MGGDGGLRVATLLNRYNKMIAAERYLNSAKSINKILFERRLLKWKAKMI